MNEGRALVYPQAIGLGARPIEVPGRGAVLCASAFFPFRLSDGAPMAPSVWYKAVADIGGPGSIPDAMAPLPGAEVLVLGALAPVVGESREAFVTCAGIDARFLLRPDPEAPDAPLIPDPAAACWHEEDNPGGRGGPDDERKPLIVSRVAPERPLWLGATPFDHPTRVRRVGVPDVSSGIGWPADADASVLHEAHEAFWTEAMHPGAPLAFVGLSTEDVEISLPRYRVAITSGRASGEWVAESVRIHALSLVPQSDLAALFWRCSIELGDDLMGESVVAVVAALEDASSPAKDAQHWAAVAADRWEDPKEALDDRPLLPVGLAAAWVSPLAPADGDDPFTARHEAAQAWMKEEIGAPEENPFASVPKTPAGAAGEMEDLVKDEDVPDANAVDALAQGVLAAAKKRHEEAGFPEPEVDPEEPRKPEIRGPALEEEMLQRLAAPYASPQEKSIADGIRSGKTESLNADEVLGRLAETRMLTSQPTLYWPAMDEQEGIQFGARVAERLANGGLARHIDVSSAIVDGIGGLTLAALQINGVLAEETKWRGVEFATVGFTSSSLAKGSFEDCVFRECTFERVNLGRATFRNCAFYSCEFRDLQLMEAALADCRFEDCRLDRVTFVSAAMRDTSFSRGTWREVQLTDSLMIGIALADMEMREVTYTATHAPHSRFERLSMFKVWATTKGFPGSVFEDVEARTCGFPAQTHFDESRFVRTRFVETGFTNAVFKEVHVEAGCRFENCDFSGALFADAELSGVHFLSCSMATSVWRQTRACDAWFWGSLLRGVDFGDTELSRAVFADADVAGTKFRPEHIIGADFRGTVRGIRGGG